MTCKTVKKITWILRIPKCLSKTFVIYWQLCCCIMGRYQCLWRFRTDFSISWDDSSVLTPERWQPLLWFHILCTILSTLSNMKQKISPLSFWIIKSYFKYIFSSPEGCLSDNFTERHSRFVLLFRGPLLCSWSVEEPDVSQCLGLHCRLPLLAHTMISRCGHTQLTV